MPTLIPLTLALLLGLGHPISENAPTPGVLALALSGYHHAVTTGEVENATLLTIIDYTLPSTQPRLFIYDPTTNEILHTSLVAHGKNTGQNHATCFGNEPCSLRSSLGFYTTGTTYHGRHGYSLRLYGLEPGINDNALARNIVIHGASYVSTEFADQHGRLGRSWGCPALPMETSDEVIDLIKDGSCLYIHGNDSAYLENSAYIVPSVR